MLPIDNRVRAMREERGLSQSELGAAIGVTRQTVAAIERRHYSPSLEVAFRLAHAFGCGIEELFSWEGG
jgi:putative transcriptional regulator